MVNASALFDDDYLEEEPSVAATTNVDEDLKRTIKQVFCTIYMILFVIGAVGNGYVISMLINIFTLLSSKKATASQRFSASGTTHMFIYVLGLSIVDLFVIMHLPLLVFEIIEGQWIFGTSLCRLYWIGESVNKLLSSFLMTVLSWDRFMAVCSPIKSIKFRNNRVAFVVLFFCVSLATVLLYPVLVNSNVKVIYKATGLPVEELKVKFPEIKINESLTVTKCTFDVSSPTVFMFYTFGVGFVLPALLISFFYLRVILRLRASAKSVCKRPDSFANNTSVARLHKVTYRVVAIVLFYFCCWLPYWSLNIALNFQILTSWSQLTLNALFFSAHILVCFNSAANPLLYALINHELRQQHTQALLKRRRSFHLNSQRKQSDRPGSIKDSSNECFVLQNRQYTYHQQQDSEISLDSGILTVITRRCKVNLPQEKLSKSLETFKNMKMFEDQTLPISTKSNTKRDIRHKTSKFQQPQILASIMPLKGEESCLVQSTTCCKT